MKIKTVLTLLCMALLASACQTTHPGVTCLMDGNYAGAVQEFQKQVEADPNDWQAREMLGYAYMKSGDSKQAIRELERVINQNPKAASMSYVFLGQAQLKLDNQEAALAAWRKFDDPSKPEVKAEIERLTTLVELENSKKLARQALASEGQRAVVATKDNSIAVFNFAISGATEKDLVPLQKALTAMTISDLAQVKGLSVIERVRLQALVDEMKLGATGAVDAATAPKAGRMLGADKLVVGNMSDKSEKVGVASSIASTSRGAVLDSFGLSNDKVKFFELQKALVAQILKSSGVTLDRSMAVALLETPHTRSLQATLFFGLGLDAQDRQDWAAAKEYFAKAAKEDPGFLMARIARDRMPVGVNLIVGSEPVSSVADSKIESAYAAQTGQQGGAGTVVVPVSMNTPIMVTTPAGGACAGHGRT